jgi:hypothetical protein
MRKRNIFIGIILVLTLAPIWMLGSETNNLRISAGVSYLNGYMLYQIGNIVAIPGEGTYNIGFIISQLKFPMNCPVADVGLKWRLDENFLLDFHLQKNIPYINGKMEDSDWGYWYLSGYSWADYTTMDIFSKSDAALDLWKADALLNYIILDINPAIIVIKGGIEYSYYHYDVRDLDQWYPSYDVYRSYISSEYGLHDYVDGLVGTYQAHKIALISGGLLKLGWEKWNAAIGADLILGMVFDMDDHILRKKKMEGSLFMYGIRGNLGLSWEISDRWSMNLKFNAEYDHADGDQTQTRYEATSEGPVGLIVTIDEIWESAFLSSGISVSYLF